MQIYNGDILVLDIAVDDDSYRYRAVMGENTLTLKFSLPEHVEIPVGSSCEYQGETYTLDKPENLKMNHTRSFDYTVEMQSSQSHLTKYKLRNMVDRRLKFSMTAKPHEHLQMLVDNLNARESGWSVGECVEGTEKLISYNHTYLLDALDQMAETFETEWEISGKTISLHKVEYNKDNPLSLAYGKGKGFKPGIGRTNYEDSVPVEILYVQGGDRNIDASSYGTSELLLPKSKTICFDGSYFEDEDGFDVTKARTYVTDADGYSIRRQDKGLKTQAEDSLDCSEIYPHRDEKILKVIAVDTEKNWYDVVTDVPESLDYSKCGIGGETPTIVFQNGMLAGREFDLETDDDGNIICEKYYENETFIGWKFQIVPATLDGMDMPGGAYLPAVDDFFRVFGIRLPEAYIEEDATKSGAAWEMFREGVKYLYDNEDAKFTFTGTLDGLWAKKDWLNIGGKIKLGGFISFMNEQFQPEPVLIRITGIKDYINNPYSPEIELSNSTKGISVSSELNKIASNEERTDGLFRDSVNFTKRRFRDAKETISMLEDAMLAGFTDSISPLTVQTMMMLVGDQSLQFRFVDSTTNPQQVIHNVEYDAETKVLTIDGGIIQHMTLGINAVSTGHDAAEYKFWTLSEFVSPPLAEPEKRFYIYAKVSRTDAAGVFYLSETANAMESEADYYYLLMGLLNSEYDGERSYVSLHGYTEVMPGQITTDVIRDTGGNLIIDLANKLITAKNGARIDGNITIGSGSSGLENLKEWPEKQKQIDGLNYLKETFGYVVDVNGVVLGKLVAVKDENDEVKAFLNGSDLGKDNDHGKLLIAGGISDIENPQNAKTKIYEDGTIDTEKLIARGGGEIGDFAIAEGGSGLGLLGSNNSETSLYKFIRTGTYMPGGYYVSAEKKRLSTASNLMDRTMKIIGVPNGALDSGDGQGMFPPVGQNNAAFAISSIERQNTSSLVSSNIALLLEAKGHRTREKNVALKILSGDILVEDGDITVETGFFKGLRQPVRVVTATTTTVVALSKYDSIIIASNSASAIFYLELQLPENPADGQMHMIFKWKPGNVRVRTTDGSTIQKPGNVSDTVVGFGDIQGMLLVVYSAEENKWWCLLISSD